MRGKKRRNERRRRAAGRVDPPPPSSCRHLAFNLRCEEANSAAINHLAVFYDLPLFFFIFCLRPSLSPTPPSSLARSLPARTHPLSRSLPPARTLQCRATRPRGLTAITQLSVRLLPPVGQPLPSPHSPQPQPAPHRQTHVRSTHARCSDAPRVAGAACLSASILFTSWRRP